MCPGADNVIRDYEYPQILITRSHFVSPTAIGHSLHTIAL